MINLPAQAIYDRIRIYIYIVDGASFVLFKYFFGGRQIAFFLVLGRLPFALSCTPWRVLGALTQELRNSRSAETFVAECFPDFHVASQHDLQAQALHLGWAGHSSGWSWLVLAGRGCGSAFGKITFKPEIEDAYVNVFLNRLQPGKLIRTGAFRSHKARS